MVYKQKQRMSLGAGLIVVLSWHCQVYAQDPDQCPSSEIAMTVGRLNSINDQTPSKLLLKGQVTYLVPKGTGLRLKLASVPTNGMRLMDRDMDGNLPPAQVGQLITARTTEDLYIDDNKVVPSGTTFYGQVSQVIPPKHVGRPGSLVISFNHFTVPGGKTFAFHCEANNYKASTTKSKLKGLGLIAAHAAGGAAVGTIIAYQLFGLQNTVALHGYNIAAGAAAGALLATGFAIWRRGPHAVLEPGDDLNLEIDNDLLLPAAVEPGTKKKSNNLPGLDVEVIKSKVVRDGLGGHNLRLTMLVTNDTAVRLNSIDLYLQDDNGSRFPVTSGDEWDEELLFHVDPHTIKRVQLDFQMDYPKLKRKLVWLDHNKQVQIYECPLP